MGKNYRDYSAEDKAAALAWLDANEGNLLRASKDLKIPYSTLQSWRDGKAITEEITELCEGKKRDLADLFEEVARTYITRALDLGAVDDTKGKDAVIAAATATDKMRLLHEQPTSISKDVTDHTHEERIARILSLVESGKAA